MAEIKSKRKNIKVKEYYKNNKKKAEFNHKRITKLLQKSFGRRKRCKKNRLKKLVKKYVWGRSTKTKRIWKKSLRCRKITFSEFHFLLYRELKMTFSDAEIGKLSFYYSKYPTDIKICRY